MAGSEANQWMVARGVPDGWRSRAGARSGGREELITRDENLRGRARGGGIGGIRTRAGVAWCSQQQQRAVPAGRGRSGPGLGAGGGGRADSSRLRRAPGSPHSTLCACAARNVLPACPAVPPRCPRRHPQAQPTASIRCTIALPAEMSVSVMRATWSAVVRRRGRPLKV